ncbi:type II toxin-antitoxin system RelE/ParE family toxin [Bacillota bacterium]
MTKIIYSKASKKVLESYEKKLALRIIEGIESIPLGDLKKLEGKRVPPLYRLRIGKYRIVYSYLNDDIIQVIKIDTRGDIYKY